MGDRGPTGVRVTRADRDLIAALGQRGLDVTPTQLKRWRGAVLLPGPVRTAHGRGLGRTSDAYPDGALDQAAAIAELAARRMALKEIALSLYLDGFPVAHEKVVAVCV